MHRDFIPCQPAVAFFKYSTMSGIRSGVPSQERQNPRKEASAVDEVVGPDAYKVAVVLSIAAAILSGCF